MMLMFILIQMKSEWYIVIISTSTNVALYIVVAVTFAVFQVTVL